MPSVFGGTTNRNGPPISDPDRANRRVKNAEANDKFVALMCGRKFDREYIGDRGGRKPSRPETDTGAHASSMNYG